jgi:hypothetical protein
VVTIFHDGSEEFRNDLFLPNTKKKKKKYANRRKNEWMLERNSYMKECMCLKHFQIKILNRVNDLVEMI